MIWARTRDRIPAINSALLAMIFFLIPTKVAPAYYLSGLMLALWVAQGGWKDKWCALRVNPVFWIFQAFFWWHVVAMIWTDDAKAGLGMLSRHLFFLLSAVYFTVARREHTHRYLAAFAIGVFICELLAGYNWLHLNRFPDWPAGLRADKDPLEIAPFVDRILFGPIVAFAGYLAALRALTLRSRARGLWALLWLFSVVGLSASGSRTGQAALCVMMALVILQVLWRRRILAVACAVLLMGLTAGGLYAAGDKFSRDRIVIGVKELSNLEGGVGRSIPLRYTMAGNTMHLIAEHPWLGVGAGDFVAAYTEINARRTPSWSVMRNPHDQMLFTVAITGVIGGVLLLAVWIAPPWFRRHRRDGLGRLGVGLCVFYVTICLAESYIWRSNTGLMFALFSALLYGPAPLRDAVASGYAGPAGQSR